MSATVPQLLDLLRASHDRLAAALSSLDEAALSGPSYHSWTIAQVASHLGSGAQISSLYVDAGLAGRPAPGSDELQALWAEWDAKAPRAQARDAVTVDAGMIDRVDELGEEDRQRWRLDLFGSQRDLAGLLQLRLAEHALHTWDIAVALDPRATITEGDAAVVVDLLAPVAAWTGRPGDGAVIDLRTSAPSGRFTLTLGERPMLSPGEPDAPTGVVRLPAEALVRLVYGRLDPAHTPASVSAEGVELDSLRAVLPGV